MLDFGPILYYNPFMITGDPFYEQYAQMCKTIVNPIRLKIIEIIGYQQMNVSEIQSNLNIPMSNLSNHLNALFQVGVVNRMKKGSFIYYSLTEPALLAALEEMRSAIASIASKKNKMMMESNIIPV